MRRRALAMTALSVVLLPVASGGAGAQTEPRPEPSPEPRSGAVAGADSPDAIEGRYIVVLDAEGAGRSSVARQAVGEQVRDLAASHGVRPDTTYRSALAGFSARLSEAQARRLAADPAVAHVEQDRMVGLDEPVAAPAPDLAGPVTQTDPRSWGLDRIDQRHRLLDDAYTYETTGDGVTVYVVDTGIKIDHPEFEGRAAYGWDTVNDDPGAGDCNGHGTHVAGTVGGTTTGVAKEVDLVAVRVLTCAGTGTTGTVIAGLDWVVAHHGSGPAVVNASLGFPASSALDQAVRGVIADRITFVTSAGNDNASACLGSPARVRTAITVAASDETDHRAAFSNHGACVDLFAPGTNIVSAWHVPVLYTMYNKLSGTSQASPHVAGSAALYLERHPTTTPARLHEVIVENDGHPTSVGDRRGSPDRMLFRPDSRPLITDFRCGLDAGEVACTLSHDQSPSLVQVRWYRNGTLLPDLQGELDVRIACEGFTSDVRAHLQNSHGYTTGRASLACPFDPCLEAAAAPQPCLADPDRTT